MRRAPKLAVVLLLASFAALSSAPARSAWTPGVPPGFRVENVAVVPGARELAFAPNGDLFVGTSGDDVYIVPHASGNPQAPRIFAHVGDAPAAGVSFAGGALYVGTQHAIWRIPYRNGDLHARSAPERIAAVRIGEPPPGSDGDVHITTSVAADAYHIYASVGSSCNACVETDPTRATIGEVKNGKYTAIAKRIRNAVALAIAPNGDLWAGDIGQDELPAGHPYEFFDDVSAHKRPVDYGWPFCYDNHKQKPGTNQNCANVALPLAIMPAYDSPMGAVFYPQHPSGRYAFPAKYAGGAFVTLHGSWHGPRQGLPGYVPPRVAFIPMRDGKPAHPVNWNNPDTQWTVFAGGYQQGGSRTRNGRPTGIAVGPQGGLFVADDQAGAVYRIRHE